ncbi:MAG: diacylglycerol/lipid kinase family protein, partial [Gaiellales bacterium]
MFLVNPASAGGSTGSRWPEIARRAAEAGLEGDALFSEEPGHLRDLACQVAAAGAELLVAVGGDGTVNEVVNGLVAAEGQAELAVIPRGTGVDFVRSFEIPTKLDDAFSV